jgi:hypothetical protein
MQCACATLSPVACPAQPYFFTFSHKRHDFGKKKVIEHKMCVLIFSTTAWNVSHSKHNWAARYDQNICWSSRKMPVILVRYWWKLNFIHRFSKKIYIFKFWILLMSVLLGAEFYLDWRKDRRTDRYDKAYSRFSRFCERAYNHYS